MNALISKNTKLLKYRYDYLGTSNCTTQRYRSNRKSHNADEKKSTFKQKENICRIDHLFLKSQHITSVINLLNYNACYSIPLRIFCTQNDVFSLQSRNFHLTSQLFDQPSSKVEASIQAVQNKQKEEELKRESVTLTTQAASIIVDSTLKQKQPTSSVDTAKKTVKKKSLKQKIWEELVHYYHGFRLLFIDINICRKLLWTVLQGNSLTRRENRLLIRTTSDLFRLVPFSVFIIIPFMEFLLPLFIKFFPGMLPSTFQTTQDREQKLKQSLAVKLEVAKFLQKTLDEMAVENKDHKSEDAKQFSEFFKKIKAPNENVSNEDIIKFSKRFQDEITLDALSREQLVALCRILDVHTLGTSNFLRFQLRMKMRNLAADDKIIFKEGVDSLNLYELQLANQKRGMRAYGLSEQSLRGQLQEWIELSLSEKVPPTLLLLSRALMISEDAPTTDKLKDTIRSLPDTLAAQTKAAIGELEGKIDNKTKIEIIKEEVRKIKEEREEERQIEKEKQKVIEQEKIKAEKDKAEILVDKAPTLEDKAKIDEIVEPVLPLAEEEIKVTKPKTQEDGSISTKDVQLLDEALAKVAKDNNQLLKEKEVIKELKEEIEDYKEDIEELKKISQVDKKVDELKESKAAQMLYKKVNHMIGSLDKVLNDLEKKNKEIADSKSLESSDLIEEVKVEKKEALVKITELVEAIKALQKVSDEGRIKAIHAVLKKIDLDKDGKIKVNDVMKVMEAIGKDDFKISEKQMEELVQLIEKEECLESEDKIEKALAKEKAEKQTIKATKDSTKTTNCSEEFQDNAPNIIDKAKDLSDEAKKIKTQEIKQFKTDCVKEADKKTDNDVCSITPPKSKSSASSKGNAL